MLEEWNKSPWGRSLHLLAHRLPRQCKDGTDWELERGFHLQVVGADFFALTLRAREETAGPTLPLLDSAKSAGQERFLIWHCPGKYRSDRLSEFAETLACKYPDHIGLILSHTRDRQRALLDFATHRLLWNKLQRPVIQVFQDYPSTRFFAVEKSLFDLGRVGRRLRKLSKIRRLMPW